MFEIRFDLIVIIIIFFNLTWPVAVGTTVELLKLIFLEHAAIVTATIRNVKMYFIILSLVPTLSFNNYSIENCKFPF